VSRYPRPLQVHATTARAHAAAAHRYSSDPFIGHWWHGKMWFKVPAPSGGRYRVTWHNTSGSPFCFYVKRLSDTIYYEVRHHRNTYTVHGSRLRAHYRNTSGRCVTKTFYRAQ
jgi:hypothetical protein